MIVPMQKITLLCRKNHELTSLERLRELGVMHVTPLASPGGPDLEKLRDQLEKMDRARSALIKAEVDWADKTPAQALPVPEDPEAAVKEILEWNDQILKAQDEMGGLFQELVRVEDLGDFDPEGARQLEEKGYALRLYQCPAGESPEAPEGTTLKIFSDDEQGVLFALAGPVSTFDKELDYRPFPLPEQGPAAMRERYAALEKEVETAQGELARRTGWKALLDQWEDRLEEQRQFLDVRLGMMEEGPVAVLQGFCPEPKLEALRKAAEAGGWGLVVEEPALEEDVPTLMEYPAWVRPIKGVFDFLQILPGYREADISIVFLFFFSIFFAMLIGDAGYGALFLGATLFARWKMPKAPAYPFQLLGVLSIGTIIWGVLTGNYFGITPLPAPLESLKIDWLTDQYNVMGICFLIGAVHLTIAHLWNTLTMLPKLQALEQVGWIGMVWVMYFTARAMVLGGTFPGFMFPVLVVALALIALFMTPVKRLKQDWILHAMLPLNVVSCFVDLVSYVRLFAVSVATVSVASSFNGMAMDAGFNSILSGFFAAMIIVLGHSLNIVLCALGILVHGVRLNTLEFSLHKQLRWSGFPYQPFRRKDKAGPSEEAA